jgi:nucleotide-binding universal stress UspA family protein
MVIRLRLRKHPIDEKVPRVNLNSLKQACEEFGREDLYKPLSWVLDLNIRWLDENLGHFVKRGRYVLVANIMLYESKTERARRYFEQALKSVKVGSPRHRRLTVVLANLDVVSKIAQRFWELARKYEAKGPPFTRLLVAVDGSKSATKAAKFAVKLAKRGAANLLVVSVVSTPTFLFAAVPEVGHPPIADYFTYATGDAEKCVNQTVSLARGQGIEAKGRVLRGSSVVGSITEYAKDNQVDLIVLGIRGSGGFKRLLVGGVSNGVVAHAHCPVLVIR